MTFCPDVGSDVGTTSLYRARPIFNKLGSGRCPDWDVAPTFRACPERGEGSASAGLRASSTRNQGTLRQPVELDFMQARSSCSRMLVTVRASSGSSKALTSFSQDVPFLLLFASDWC